MSKYGYMCGVSWQHEIGEDNAPKVLIYSCPKILKKLCKCWPQCGIVKVKVELDSWLEKQDLDKVIDE